MSKSEASQNHGSEYVGVTFGLKMSVFKEGLFVKVFDKYINIC